MHIFSGIHKNRSLTSPKGDATRPTSGRLREALFNICQHYNSECRFLDLFAGSGAMGLEALSRGASHATFIDSNKESIRSIQDNIRICKEEKRTKIIQGDVFDQIKKLAREGKQYDIIYADPPYENTCQTEDGSILYSVRLLTMLDQLINSETSLLAPEGVLFIEESAGVSLESIPLSCLELKNSRNTGRAALHYYILK